MKHQKIITQVSTVAQYEACRDRLKEEYPGIEVTNEEEFTTPLYNDPSSSIALIATQLDTDLHKLCFSDKCMEGGTFNPEHIYQGDDFDKCEICTVQEYLVDHPSAMSECFNPNSVYLYDKDENEIAKCSSIEDARTVCSSFKEVFVYFNNKTIDLNSLTDNEQAEILELLFE